MFRRGRSDTTGYSFNYEFGGLSRAAPDAALLRRGQGCPRSSKNGHRRDSLPYNKHANGQTGPSYTRASPSSLILARLRVSVKW